MQLPEYLEYRCCITLVGSDYRVLTLATSGRESSATTRPAARAPCVNTSQLDAATYDATLTQQSMVLDDEVVSLAVG